MTKITNNTVPLGTGKREDTLSGEGSYDVMKEGDVHLVKSDDQTVTSHDHDKRLEFHRPEHPNTKSPNLPAQKLILLDPVTQIAHDRRDSDQDLKD